MGATKNTVVRRGSVPEDNGFCKVNTTLLYNACKQQGVYYLSLLFFSQTSSKQIKLAALILRRTLKSEEKIYQQTIPYQATDYEVLLRYWPAEPYLNSLAAFSGPAYSNPEVVLVENCRDWSEKLAETSGHPNHTGIKGMINGWMD